MDREQISDAVAKALTICGFLDADDNFMRESAINDFLSALSEAGVALVERDLIIESRVVLGSLQQDMDRLKNKGFVTGRGRVDPLVHRLRASLTGEQE